MMGYLTGVWAPKLDLSALDWSDLEALQIDGKEAARFKPLKIHMVRVRPDDTPESLAAGMASGDFRLERFQVLNGLKSGQPLRVGQVGKLVRE